ncbi:16379_t:CDS:2, partial [Acaulospora colombiana]
IEYLLQDIILTKEETSKIDARIRTNFRRRTKLVITCPNTILYLTFLYNIMELNTKQQQKFASNFQALYEAKNTAGLVTRLRIQKLQYDAWQKTRITKKCSKINSLPPPGKHLEFLLEETWIIPPMNLKKYKLCSQ